MGTRAQIEQLVAQATTKVPDANARIDALEKTGPPVLVALMILADAIDVLRQHAMGQAKDSRGSDDLTAQLRKLTSQVTKLTKTAKKITKTKTKRKRNKNKRKKRNKRNK